MNIRSIIEYYIEQPEQPISCFEEEAIISAKDVVRDIILEGVQVILNHREKYLDGLLSSKETCLLIKESKHLVIDSIKDIAQFLDAILQDHREEELAELMYLGYDDSADSDCLEAMGIINY